MRLGMKYALRGSPLPLQSIFTPVSFKPNRLGRLSFTYTLHPAARSGGFIPQKEMRKSRNTERPILTKGLEMPRSTPAVPQFHGCRQRVKEKQPGESEVSESKCEKQLQREKTFLHTCRRPAASGDHLHVQGLGGTALSPYAPRGRCGGPGWGRGESGGEAVSEVPRSGQQEGRTGSWGTSESR